VPRPDPAAAPEGASFGDNPKLHAKNKVDDIPQTLHAAVTKVTAIAGGMYLVALDNGQVWQTTRSDWAIEFSRDDNVTIKRLPLGSYEISDDEDPRTVSAKRIK